MIVEIEYVDHGVHGEYGFLGKVVARSIVRGLTDEARTAEIAEMKTLLGEHVVAREIEEIPAVV
jgi:hypothetical protein